MIAKRIIPLLIVALMLAAYTRARCANESISILHSFGYHAGLDGGATPTTLVKLDGAYYGTTLYGGTASCGTLFQFDPSSGNVTVLHSFCDGTVAGDAQAPNSLIAGSDGNLYGTSSYGGSTAYGGETLGGAGAGALFEYVIATGKVKILHSFDDGSVTNDGIVPNSVTQDSYGNLWGTCMWGGSTGMYGVLFQYNHSSQTLTIVHSFGDGSVTNDGQNPDYIMQGQDHVFYGCTDAGGKAGAGVLFAYNFGIDILHSFGDGTVSGDGREPSCVVQAKNGNLFGETTSALYIVAATTGKMSILHDFTGYPDDGYNPNALAFDSNGVLYGITYAGGQGNRGTLFQYTSSSGLKYLYSFQATSTTDGNDPVAIVGGENGTMYGVTYYGGPLGTTTQSSGMGTVFEFDPTGPQTTVVHNFGGVVTDGYWPDTLIQGSNGDLYCGTQNGGTSAIDGAVRTGYGVVSEFDAKTGTGDVIYNLSWATNNEDGATVGALAQVGNLLYGAAMWGGTNQSGILFDVDPSNGDESILHEFNPSLTTDCGYPTSLVLAPDGELYGGAFSGGAHSTATLFEYALPSGPLTVAHSFDTTDGAGSVYLIVGADHNIYGVTTRGGAQNDGTLFQFDIASGTLNTLWQFGSDLTSTTDPAFPVDIVQGVDGNLYGVTEKGGSSGDGVLFEFDMTSGQVSVLHTFGDGSVALDGFHPVAIALGADGNLYGITPYGGYRAVHGWGDENGDGTLFEYSASGGLKILHDFGDGSITLDGAEPTTILAGADGNIYGTTGQGGAAYEGTLFMLPLTQIKSIVFKPAAVTGGSSTTATVNLTGPAPIGGLVLTIKAKSTDITLPSPTATIPAGSTSVSFTVDTVPVAAKTHATLAAKIGKVGKSAQLTIKPAELKSLALSPTAVKGGKTSTGTVTLTGVAAADTIVQLTSDDSAASVPGSVTVTAGTSSATFTIQTTKVAAKVVANITATQGTAVKAVMLTIKP
jgi:uncharacterized repeat protein (TIGR03803 family)